MRMALHRHKVAVEKFWGLEIPPQNDGGDNSLIETLLASCPSGSGCRLPAGARLVVDQSGACMCGGVCGVPHEGGAFCLMCCTQVLAAPSTVLPWYFLCTKGCNHFDVCFNSVCSSADGESGLARQELAEHCPAEHESAHAVVSGQRLAALQAAARALLHVDQARGGMNAASADALHASVNP